MNMEEVKINILKVDEPNLNIDLKNCPQPKKLKYQFIHKKTTGGTITHA